MNPVLLLPTSHLPPHYISPHSRYDQTLPNLIQCCICAYEGHETLTTIPNLNPTCSYEGHRRPDNTAQIEWRFDGDKEIIHHVDNNDDKACRICDRWADHYRFKNGKAGSLEKARSARNDWFLQKVLTSLKPFDGYQELGAKSQELEEVREELSGERTHTNILRKELKNTGKALEVELQKNVTLLQENSLLLKLPRHEEVREVDHLHEVLDEQNRWLARVDERLREVQKERDSLRRDLNNTQWELENARQQQVLKMHTPPPHTIEDAYTSAAVAFSPSRS